MVSSAIVLTSVDSVGGIPSRGVVSASEDTATVVLVQDVRDEELALVGVSGGRNADLNIESGLSVASCGAHRGIVRLGLGEGLNAHVAGGGIDGGVVEVDGTGEARLGGGRSEVVEVGAGDHDVEVVLPASYVGELLCWENTSENGTLDVGD